MLSRKYFKTFSRSLFLPPGIAVLELPLFETFLCQFQFFILTERIVIQEINTLPHVVAYIFF